MTRLTDIRRARAPLACVLALLGLAPQAHAALAAVANPNPALIARWEPCEPNTGVTVIVDERTLAEAKVYVGCALGEQEDGIDALEHAGFAPEGTTDYGLDFVCRIDGEPTAAEQPCITTPGAGSYWSYWRAKAGGRWGYSGVGANSPQSRSAVNSVEGWSFGGGGAPRVEPMDGSGPSSFELPPAQESSVIPAALAREWLARTLTETAHLAEAEEAEGSLEVPGAELALRDALALGGAGVPAGALAPTVDWLSRGCLEKGASVEGCPLRRLANPAAKHEEQNAERFALAVLGLPALGQNPASFAGMNLRGALEAMIEKSTGAVKSEGESSEAFSVTAPTVLALARTGTLPAKALKTLQLILAHQNPGTGAFEGVTAIDAETVEALVAAREQGAGVLGTSLLAEVEGALAKAGAYLESIQEPDGGVRKQESTEPIYDPSVLSTAQGAAALALSGRKASGERAARWVSRYQMTAEYAGLGNPDTGEHTPAEGLIGGFLPSEAALRNALVAGLHANPHGVDFEAQLPTADALLALDAAGPYGPYDLGFESGSLALEARVGAAGRPLAATLVNHDVRPVTLAATTIAGVAAGDFRIAADGCAGRTLAPSESCEVSVGFAPTIAGAREALLEISPQGSAQTLALLLDGIATAAPLTGPEPTGAPSDPGQGPSGSQGVLGAQTAGPPLLQDMRAGSAGAARGLVQVSWSLVAPGAGAGSWTIASRALGVRGAPMVTRASGDASATSALLALPPGRAYELRLTYTDALARSASAQIGEVLVPYDDRAGALHYRGRWRRLRQAGAWLGTVSRGDDGAQVSVSLPAGRPVFLLRVAGAGARVEVLAADHRQRFVLTRGAPAARRALTAATRTRAGTVTLRVLKGTVDLDGVAVEG